MPKSMHFFVFIFILILHISHGKQSEECNNNDLNKITKTLNYSILNKGQNIEISLDKYFSNPGLVNFNKDASTPNIADIINISKNSDPLSEIQNFTMSVDIDGKPWLLNESTIYQMKSIYNQPTKIYLLSNNTIFIHHFHLNDQNREKQVPMFIIYIPSSAKFIDKSFNCTNIEIYEKYNQEHLIVLCENTTKNAIDKAYVLVFKFNKTRDSSISNLNYAGQYYRPNLTEAKATNCSKFKLFTFKNISISRNRFQNQSRVAIFCSESEINSSYVWLYSKDIQNMFNVQIFPNAASVMNCLRNTTFIVEYEKGFLSIIRKNSNNKTKYYLNEYKPGILISICQQILEVTNYTFITSIQSGSISYIYILYNDRIEVKESYSPNHQDLAIDNMQNYTLASYSITPQLLLMLFRNNDNNSSSMLVYDLTFIYPKLIYIKNDFTKDYTKNINLFSTFNYLEKANYFFIYDRSTNNMSLQEYRGYKLILTLKDSENLKGVFDLIFQVQQQIKRNRGELCSLEAEQQLHINIYIRSFQDSTITKNTLVNLTVDQKIIKINLADSVIGPLGRFYTYPNNISDFQYINSFSQIDITKQLSKQQHKIITASISLQLKNPVLTFYYESTLQICELTFQNNTKKTDLTNCSTVSKKTSTFSGDVEIVILSFGRFLQFQDNKLEICIISSPNNDITCQLISNGSFEEKINKIKVISYDYDKDGFECIEMFIIFSKELIYCEFIKNDENSPRKYYVNMHITPTQIIDLRLMSIKDIFFDETFQKYLVLYLALQTKNRTLQNQVSKVLVFDPPQIQQNSSSTLIGHLIYAIESNPPIFIIEGVFCIDSMLIVLSSKINEGFFIQEYLIEDNFRVRPNRMYPLYNHQISFQGNHTTDGKFIYLETDSTSTTTFSKYYLVYCPSLKTTNVLTHSFMKRGDQNLKFFQNCDKNKNYNSIGFNGRYLFALSFPNLILKFKSKFAEMNPPPGQSSNQIATLSQKSNMPSEVQQTIQVSLIDNHNILKILSYNFSYATQKWKISYTIDDDITINKGKPSQQMKIDYKRLVGPVSEYELKMEIKKQNKCNLLQISATDVFSKLQCLLYYNAKQYGIMQDFISFRNTNNNDIEIIITESHLICVLNKQINETQSNDKELQECKFQRSNNTILLICKLYEDDSTKIYLIKYKPNCQIIRVEIQTPSWFKYQQFDLIYSAPYILFEVPIRFKYNKIYYLSTFDQEKTAITAINSKYCILKNMGQEEFLTIDHSVKYSNSNSYFFLMQKGIGIYNLSTFQEHVSMNMTKISPMVWIDRSQLERNTKIGQNEQLKYITYKNDSTLGNSIFYMIELGTKTSSYELLIALTLTRKTTSNYNQQSNEKQPNQSITLNKIEVLYTYLQYVNCYNNLHSESMFLKGKNILVKICHYEPEETFVFANYISITEKISNSYIQFYQRNSDSTLPFQYEHLGIQAGHQRLTQQNNDQKYNNQITNKESYPFRMEIVYTNQQSNDNFEITDSNILIVGSLFNLLCYYQLSHEILWEVSIIEPKSSSRYHKNDFKSEFEDSSDDVIIPDANCSATLVLKNLNEEFLINFNITMDDDELDQLYWFSFEYNIQRIIFILITINTIRLILKNRQKKTFKLKKKIHSNGMHSHQFQFMVKLNSKIDY